jgi:hypothetical protein
MEGCMTPLRFEPVDRNVVVTFRYHAGYGPARIIGTAARDHLMQIGQGEADIRPVRPTAAERTAVD